MAQYEVEGERLSSRNTRNALPSWGNEVWLTRGQRRFIGTVVTIAVVGFLITGVVMLTQDWSQRASGATMSTIDFITPDFLATYISGGNGDALTWIQSLPMRDRLVQQGVHVTPLFWPADHVPALPHEYQFHLDGEDAQAALVETLEFLAGVAD